MFRIRATGYWGEKEYKNGGNKITTEACFMKKEHVLQKKKQFEKWAELNHIPPYEIEIDEIPDNPSIADD